MRKQLRLVALAVSIFVAGPAFAQTAAKPTAAPDPAAEKKPHPLRNVHPGEAYAYFSGNEKSSHNLPAIYAYQADIQKLVVIGKGYRKEFPISQTEDAFKAYHALLKNRGYKVDDPRNGRSPFYPATK